jgi:dUTP pyrophosphatase
VKTDKIHVPVKRVNGYTGPLPRYVSPGSAGMDLGAFLPSPLSIAPMERVLVPTGIAVAVPKGYEGQVRPRSGLALEFGVTLVNTPGTIDSDYRGEIRVILINLGRAAFVVKPGDRIAQLVVAPVAHVAWEETDDLPATTRGEGGFGHSGT